jgi:hypothetical protein
VKNMPFRDGTGPMGRGPMSGRGMGPCAGGRGFGRGFGRRGVCRFPITISKEEEKQMIEEEIESLKKRLEELK